MSKHHGRSNKLALAERAMISAARVMMMEITDVTVERIKIQDSEGREGQSHDGEGWTGHRTMAAGRVTGQ